jgi:hypothetical protein
MSKVISRKPFVGLVSGTLFGALGMLLLGIEGARGVAGALFKVSAGFFLFIGAFSLSAGIYAFYVRTRGRKDG